MKLHSASSPNCSSLRKPGSTFILFLLALLMLSACDSKADFSYSDGSTGQYADFSGKFLVINYWAEWCKPCIKEIPELNEFAATHKNVHVVGVNYDIFPLEKEQALIKKLDIRFPVARTFLHEHYGYPMPMSLPTTVIISPKGMVINILQGPQTVATLSKAVNL